MDGIDLSEASTRTLDLRGCHVGAIRLYHTKINGVCRLSGAHPDGKAGPALGAKELTVTASMLCDEGFEADGAISLARRQHRGPLGPQGCTSGRQGWGRPGRRRAHRHRENVLRRGIPGQGTFDGVITLEHAKIGRLLDGKRVLATTPEPSRIDLRRSDLLACLGSDWTG